MTLLEILVWSGILTFAAMGALTAVNKQFDLREGATQIMQQARQMCERRALAGV